MVFQSKQKGGAVCVIGNNFFLTFFKFMKLSDDVKIIIITIFTGVGMVNLICLIVWSILYYQKNTIKSREKLSMVISFIDISERANVEILCEDDISCYNRERAIRAGLYVERIKVGKHRKTIYTLNGVEVYKD